VVVLHDCRSQALESLVDLSSAHGRCVVKAFYCAPHDGIFGPFVLPGLYDGRFMCIDEKHEDRFMLSVSRAFRLSVSFCFAILLCELQFKFLQIDLCGCDFVALTALRVPGSAL